MQINSYTTVQGHWASDGLYTNSALEFFLCQAKRELKSKSEALDSWSASILHPLSALCEFSWHFKIYSPSI